MAPGDTTVGSTPNSGRQMFVACLSLHANPERFVGHTNIHKCGRPKLRIRFAAYVAQRLIKTDKPPKGVTARGLARPGRKPVTRLPNRA